MRWFSWARPGLESPDRAIVRRRIQNTERRFPRRRPAVEWLESRLVLSGPTPSGDALNIIRQFDFNTAVSPNEPGWISVKKGDLFNLTAQAGWEFPVTGDFVDPSPGVGDVARDGHFGSFGRFRIRVVPGQTYNVELIFRDKGGAEFLIDVNGTAPVAVSLPKLTVVTQKFSNVVSNTDFLTIQFQATSTRGRFVVNGLRISPTSVNSPPIARDDSLSVNEDSSGSVNPLANDSDPDGDLLSVTGHSQPAHGVVSNNAGIFTYTPSPNYSGSDSFNYAISDGRGGTATGVVNILVNEVNDPPVAVNDGGPGFSTTAGTSFNTASVLTNDFDVDGDPLTVTGINTSLTAGTVTSIGNGKFKYTPPAGFFGTDRFNYVVSDGRGGTNSATVTIVVEKGNAPPVANPDSGTGFVTNVGTSFITASVLANDSDPDGDSISVVALNTSLTTGSVTHLGNGTFWYSPLGGFTGADRFVYMISDGNGGTATATVTVQVKSVNSPPVAVADGGSGFETTVGKSFTTTSVLTNDYDPDGDPLGIVAINTSQTLGSVASNGNGTFQFNPAPGYSGTDRFSYTISDGKGGTATATVTVVVKQLNNPPVANPDSGLGFETTAGNSLTTPSVLTNDRDLDGDPLTIIGVDTSLTVGSVTSLGNGTFRYAPPAGFTGTDRFGYTISDGRGGTSSTTVTINVRDAIVSVPGIWIRREELMALPTSGTAWNTLLLAAKSTTSTPKLSNQDDNSDVLTLAKALVGVRLNDQSLMAQVRANIQAAIGTEVGGRTLALGRNLASFVIAADLVGLPPDLDAVFRSWLRTALTETLEGRTLQSTHEDRPNNWGTMAGGSRAAIAVYLGDQVELDRAAQVFRGYLGDRSAYAGFDFGSDLSWQADPNAPVGINPKGAMKEGHSIDGVIPDDMRRGGSFTWPPASTGYPWEALQGVLVQAEILHRAGYDAWQWSDQAVKRAVEFLYGLGWAAGGDDGWQPWLVNARYGTQFSASPTAKPGKIMGWTAWTHGSAGSSSALTNSMVLPNSPTSTTDSPLLGDKNESVQKGSQGVSTANETGNAGQPSAPTQGTVKGRAIGKPLPDVDDDLTAQRRGLHLAALRALFATWYR